MKTSKRLWALLLTVCMVLAMIPAVSAAGDVATKTVTYDFNYLNVCIENFGSKANPGNTWNDVTKANIKALHDGSGTLVHCTNNTELATIDQSYLNWYFVDSGSSGTKTFARATNGDGYYFEKMSGSKWTAFAIDNPGVGTWNISVLHPAGYYGASRVNVYFLPMTNDIAGAVASATENTYFNCWQGITTISSSADLSKMGTTNNGGTWTVTDDTVDSYLCVIEAKEKGGYNFHTYLTAITLTSEAAEKEDEAMIGTESYATLQDAIEDAKSGDEIVLQTAVEADKVQVPLGVTVNLNGKTLTAGEIEIAGALVDTDGNGLLVTNTTITCSGDNGGYLPLTDSTAGGYRLCKPTLETLGKVPSENGTAAYWFHAHFEKEAAYGYTGVEIGVQMTWDGGSKGAWAGETFMGNWATQVKADKDLDIKLTVTGLDSVTNFKLTPVIKANGVTISMDTL